jgi:hypothetical protein
MNPDIYFPDDITPIEERKEEDDISNISSIISRLKHAKEEELSHELMCFISTVQAKIAEQESIGKKIDNLNQIISELEDQSFSDSDLEEENDDLISLYENHIHNYVIRLDKLDRFFSRFEWLIKRITQDRCDLEENPLLYDSRSEEDCDTYANDENICDRLLGMTTEEEE